MVSFSVYNVSGIVKIYFVFHSFCHFYWKNWRTSKISIVDFTWLKALVKCSFVSFFFKFWQYVHICFGDQSSEARTFFLLHLLLVILQVLLRSLQKIFFGDTPLTERKKFGLFTNFCILFLFFRTFPCTFWLLSSIRWHKDPRLDCNRFHRCDPLHSGSPVGCTAPLRLEDVPLFAGMRPVVELLRPGGLWLSPLPQGVLEAALLP